MHTMRIVDPVLLLEEGWTSTFVTFLEFVSSENPEMSYNTRGYLAYENVNHSIYCEETQMNKEQR